MDSGANQFGSGHVSYAVLAFKPVVFPICVCFLIATTKAQGQRFGEMMRFDLGEEFFSHGQLYVALSRATRVLNIVLLSKREKGKP